MLYEKDSLYKMLDALRNSILEVITVIRDLEKRIKNIESIEANKIKEKEKLLNEMKCYDYSLFTDNSKGFSFFFDKIKEGEYDIKEPEEIKPCPWCLTVPCWKIRDDFSRDGMYYVRCNTCTNVNISTETFKTKKEALAAWNKRGNKNE